ncbi:MAG: sulfotransferase domain-containing protein [Betaproteobacteria bacterium]|nr:sulfotransferase domain-containing protein [Betaproteobacteria bacterium]
MQITPAMSCITHTLYRFGGLGSGHYGYMALREDGCVGAYSHPNECRYELRDGELRFLNAAGETTNLLRYYPDANVFLGTELYLLPVLRLNAVPETSTLPPLLINSIPKSGTYFVEAAMARLGMQPLRLHLSSHLLHDYRGIAEADMHRQPEARAVNAPAGAVATLLRPGSVVVGHLEDHGQLNAVKDAGVRIFHLTRDLREVLISLYHFKKDRVAPVSPADNAWRSLPPEESFIAFLVCFEKIDIRHIAAIAATILDRAEPVLHYAQAINGIVPPELEYPGFGEALRATRGQPTSTLSRRDRGAMLWSPAAEEFFSASGLRSLNQRLGYGCSDM